jgi:UDP-N-acetylglucosamine 2-epimerase
MPIKIMFVFGTRPEAIKMVPLIKKMQLDPNFKIVICVTAQHRNMLDQTLQIFNITPDYDLDIMKSSQSLSDITSKSLIGLENIMKGEKPDLVLVHGDTSTTFAAALAAFYNKIKIGHVEAGLRTFNKYQPFPEEMNRKLVADLSDLHFAPTLSAKSNLIKEGIDENIIFITGNTVIDCIKHTIKNNYEFKNEALGKINYADKKVIVVTAHRRENLGKPLENICNAILKLSANKNLEFVYAVHSNPLVRNTVEKILSGHDNIHLIEPLDIENMHNLISKSFLVMTDSGGIQEEAPSFDKPVLVLRNVTERPEGVLTGALKLVGTDQNKIFDSVNELINDKKLYEKMSKAQNPFGDGKASERICNAILFYFGRMQKPTEFIF